jgi:hypothetical protein
MNKDQTTNKRRNPKRTSRYNLVISFTKVIISIVYFFSGRHVVLPKIDYLEKFLYGMEHMIQNRGLTETIRLYKEYYRIAQKIVLKQTFEALPYHKTIRGTNVPKVLKPLFPFLVSGHKWPARIALTYARAYTLLVTTPRPDLSPILDPGLIIQEKDLDEFVHICNEQLKPLPLPEYKSDWKFSSAQGPNGQAVLYSHVDAIALRKEGLMSLWREIADTVYHPLRSSIDNILATFKDDDFPEARTGRLAFLPEKGGKTRTIAIGDFWSQELLKGFHFMLMNVLRYNFEGPDSTFDQNNGFNRVKTLSNGKGTYSFDLKSATDRVPMVLQRIVLKTLWPELGDKIADLLSKRDFHVKGREPIRWKVGQPLGIYSSWPLFTLTHHIIVQLSARSVGIKTRFLDYQILGDDIVIWNSKVASAYVSKMESYGVFISKEKTLISPYFSSGEFCKRLFINGIELSPLSLNVIKDCVSLYGLPNLYTQLKERFELPSIPLGHLVFESFPLTKRGKLYTSILIGMLQTLEDNHVGYPLCSMTNDRTTLLKALSSYYGSKRTQSLLPTIKPHKGEVCINTIQKVDDALRRIGLVVPSSLLQPTYEDGDAPHPIALMTYETIAPPSLDSFLQKKAVQPGSTQEEYLSTMKEPIHLDMNHFLIRNKNKTLPQALLTFYLKTDKDSRYFTQSLESNPDRDLKGL